MIKDIAPVPATPDELRRKLGYVIGLMAKNDEEFCKLTKEDLLYLCDVCELMYYSGGLDAQLALLDMNEIHTKRIEILKKLTKSL